MFQCQKDKIQASIFTLMPIIDFEFYQIKSVPIDMINFKHIMNSQEFGYLSAEEQHITPLSPYLSNCERIKI